MSPTLAAAARVELTTAVPGVVEEVLVVTGQRVKVGQPLLRLDATRYRARVEAAEGAVLKVREEAAEAARALARTQDLYDSAVGSTTELDAARLRDAHARGELQQAAAQLKIARKDLDDTVLRAPFSGVVHKRLAEPGLLVPGESPPPVLLILVR
jgi:RND family efflux transporter MFP subunit